MSCIVIYFNKNFDHSKKPLLLDLPGVVVIEQPVVVVSNVAAEKKGAGGKKRSLIEENNSESPTKMPKIATKNEEIE